VQKLINLIQYTQKSDWDWQAAKGHLRSSSQAVTQNILYVFSADRIRYNQAYAISRQLGV